MNPFTSSDRSLRSPRPYLGETSWLAFLIFVVAVSSWAAVCHAEDPISSATKEMTKSVLPTDQRTEISEGSYWLAYVVAVGGFLLVAGLTTIAVRLVAALLIAASLIGGALVMFLSVYNRSITSWEELIAATVVLGVSAGLITISASIYLHAGKSQSA